MNSIVNRLVPQSTYRLRGFSPTIDLTYRHQLLSMGIRPGMALRIMRVAPLGDPIQLEVGRLNIMLRRKDLEQFTMDVLTD